MIPSHQHVHKISVHWFREHNEVHRTASENTRHESMKNRSNNRSLSRPSHKVTSRLSYSFIPPSLKEKKEKPSRNRHIQGNQPLPAPQEVHCPWKSSAPHVGHFEVDADLFVFVMEEGAERIVVWQRVWEVPWPQELHVPWKSSAPQVGQLEVEDEELIVCVVDSALWEIVCLLWVFWCLGWCSRNRRRKNILMVLTWEYEGWYVW